jgi:hypothetical protein
VHLEPLGEPDDLGQTRVALAAFDAADVVAVESGRLRHRLLRQPQLLAPFADDATKRLLNFTTAVHGHVFAADCAVPRSECPGSILELPVS